MMNFKVKFPTGYQIIDVLNDNIDIHVILPDDRVFFGTGFTILNIKHLTQYQNNLYFWATDMIVFKNLELTTIKMGVQQAIDDGLFERIFSHIGFSNTIYSPSSNYNNMLDETS